MIELLSVDQLSFSYNQSPVLENISLSLPPGRVAAVVGGSGAGKTTLLKCILLLLRPRNGVLSYFSERKIIASISEISDPRIADGGWDIPADIDVGGMRARIGYVPQGSVLLPFKTLKANVELPLRLCQGRSERQCADFALDALQQMGVADIAESLPWEVSGGQLQRAAIARAMAMRPELYLLDEPTGSLDAANVDIVGNRLRYDVRKRETAALIVTHNLGFAQKYCDDLYVLKDCSLRGPIAVGDVDWAALLGELI
jgi:ABC-type polar amino acid transport system ATPase subunit